MSVKKLSVLLGVLVVISMILTACPAPQQQVVEKVVTQVVEKQVEVEKVVTQVVEKEKVVEKEVEVLVTPTPVPVTRTGAWLDTVVMVEEPSADAAVTRLQTGDIDIYAFQVSNREVAAKVAETSDLLPPI